MLDEPTSALDMLIQAQIVDLLRSLQEKYRLAYLFISHDLRVVRALADEVMVLKDGKVVEHGPAAQIMNKPKADYTRALMAAAFNLEATEGDYAVGAEIDETRSGIFEACGQEFLVMTDDEQGRQGSEGGSEVAANLEEGLGKAVSATCGHVGDSGGLGMKNGGARSHQPRRDNDRRVGRRPGQQHQADQR